MKKTLTILVTIFLVSFLVSCSNSKKTIDNLIFSDVLEDEEVVAYQIIGYNKDLPRSITLPKEFTTVEHGTKPVIKIGARAFHGSSLKAVVIPPNYKVIEEAAFFDSRKLEKVIFEGNSELISIGDNAFKDTVELRSIVIPKSVKTIGNFAFSNAQSLSLITFEEGSLLETIGSNAFSETNIEEIMLPSKVENIGSPLFYNCKRLKNIYVQVGNINFSTVDGVLYNRYKTKLIIYPSGKKDTEYTLLEEVLEVSNHAFYNNEHLTKIVLNDNLEKIGILAFARMKKVETLIVPLSVDIIETDAFKTADNLTLYLEHLEEGSNFSKHWNSSSLVVYYKPNWNIDEDGNPSPTN
jgi:hypothetical protein